MANPEIASLPDDFGRWSEADQDLYLMRMRWIAQARANQLPPDGLDWYIWLLLSGRGFGKTRTAAEDVAYCTMATPGYRYAVVAPTFADVRDTCIEGESGVMSILPAKYVRTWNRSIGELHLVNGSIVRGFSADEPNRLRGPQFHRAWADELAAYEKAAEVLTQLQLSTRLPSDPKIIITTTPRPIKTIRDLIKNPRCHVTTGSTFDNKANLAASTLEVLREQYEGTRIGRQELYAEVLEDMAGALWNRDILDKHRVKETPQLTRVIVAVDPAMAAGGMANETGIVVAGVASNGHAYVMKDATVRGAPDFWARTAVMAFHANQADKMVGEVNNGGDLVRATIHTVDPNIPFRAVTATRGKIMRAEPVAALYEQGKVHHVGMFDKLEDQMVQFTGLPGDESPDRLDALVWALTELMLSRRACPMVAPISIESANYWKGA